MVFMKKVFLLICYCALCTSVFSQIDFGPHPRPKNCNTENSCPRNTLFAESNVRFNNLFGLVSINLDHTLICRTNYLLSYCLGADLYSFKHTRAAGVPLTLNLMIGGGPLMLEIGVGVNYLYVYKNYDGSTNTYNANQNYLGLIGNVGVRFEQKNSVFFRAGFTPMYSLFNDNIPILAGSRFNTMFGLGVGYTF